MSDGTPLSLVLTVGEVELLHVHSNGYGTFHVQGTQLRHEDTIVAGRGREYHTRDDKHVMGEVILQLGALLSGEVLRRALFEHDAVILQGEEMDAPESAGADSPAARIKQVWSSSGDQVSLTDEWKHEVASGDTALGLRDWIDHTNEADRISPQESAGADSPTPKVASVTWVKDAALQYVGRPGAYSMTDTHEYDAILHVFVRYDDGATREWEGDGKGVPEWALDAIQVAVDQDEHSIVVGQAAYELADAAVNPGGYADDPDEADRRAELRDALRLKLLRVANRFTGDEESAPADSDQLADTDDLIVAKEELESLYDYEQNNADNLDRLHGLDTAITVLARLIAKAPAQSADADSTERSDS